MKKICVFYNYAWRFLSKKVEWIICKECQKKLAKGEPLKVRFRLPASECPKCGRFMTHGECSECGYCGCSFDPTSANDYCSAHRPR